MCGALGVEVAHPTLFMSEGGSSVCVSSTPTGGSCLETLQRTAGFMGTGLGNILLKIRRLTGVAVHPTPVDGARYV